MGSLLGTLPFLARFDLFLLFFLRAGALIFASPIFGRTNAPAMLRAGLAFFVAIAFFMGNPDMPMAEWSSIWDYALIAIKEVLFGVCMGFATTTFFASTLFAGSIIDMQVGFSMAQVLDPQTNQQVPLLGNLLNNVMLISFFIVGGHLRLIGILSETLPRVPVGQVAVRFDQLAASALSAFSSSFLLGFQVAMPVIAVALLLEVALGTMNRTVPQLNMYVLGLPVKVAMGLVLLALTMPAFVHMTNGAFDALFQSIGFFFEGLIPP